MKVYAETARPQGVDAVVAAPLVAVTRDRGIVDAFWRTADGGLGHASSRRGAWRRPEDFADVRGVSSPPTVAVTADDVADVLWQGTDGGTVWNGPDRFGMGVLGSAPVAAGRPDGSIDVFWRGADGGLRRASTTGRRWCGPQDMAAGTLGSDPFPVASTGTTTDVLWLGETGSLRHKWSIDRGKTWNGPADLGMGRPGSPPVAAGRQEGTIDVLWKGVDAALWHARYHGRWTGPHRIGGSVG